ncbi:hypothetical protein LCGC14_1125600 [marine sediment metagenome]|uniref:Uncharacterized protein n=1 Tax=marine sediment metagenome TaxID=412755 RepID=A0A0F9MQL8_9ZZZZ
MDPKLQEKLDDPQFAALLEQSEQHYEDADSYYNWDPPNGQHVVALTIVKEDKVNSKKLKMDVLRVRVTCQIMDGDDVDKSFDISGGFGWSAPYLNGMKTLASMMAGEPVLELIPALAVLHDNIGQWFYVSTTRTEAKDGSGKIFVNHRVTDRAVEGATAEAPAE